MKELRIEFFGRVQGVRFRHFVRNTAEKMGINGYVMNKEDGSVLVIAQGNKEELDIFLTALQRGSFFSKIEGVFYLWQKPKNIYEEFSISLNKGLFEDQKSSFTNLGKKIFGFKDKVPKHIAVIPDGNRRWAKKRGLKGVEGHKSVASIEKFSKLFDVAKEYGVGYFTFWAFSTENWKRDKEEVEYLFDLLKNFAREFRDYAIKNKIRFRHLGRKDRIPKDVLLELEKTEDATKKFSNFCVQICLDYGGRDEITRAINKILKSGVNEISEDDVVNYLDSAGIPDPDLIIRTSGEKRLSGLMPFQSAYSELYFTDVYFPDFGPADLEKAIEEYGNRARRFGGS